MIFSLTLGCVPKRNNFQKNIFRAQGANPDLEFNCGGFQFLKGRKTSADSSKINIRIISCIDKKPIPFAWIKLYEQSAETDLKITADKEGKVYKTLPIGSYRIESTSVHYNLVKTPLLILSNNEYYLTFYLGSGDPIIN